MKLGYELQVLRPEDDGVVQFSASSSPAFRFKKHPRTLLLLGKSTDWAAWVRWVSLDEELTEEEADLLDKFFRLREKEQNAPEILEWNKGIERVPWSQKPMPSERNEG
jgi:hypothetical protein